MQEMSALYDIVGTLITNHICSKERYEINYSIFNPIIVSKLVIKEKRVSH